MTLTEKAAYIKGLMDASELDKTSKEGKILAAVVDLLDDMALTVSDLEDTCAELDEYVEELDMDLGEMEKDIYGDEDEHGDGCDCGCDDDGYHYQTCLLYTSEDPFLVTANAQYALRGRKIGEIPYLLTDDKMCIRDRSLIYCGSPSPLSIRSFSLA